MHGGGVALVIRLFIAASRPCLWLLVPCCLLVLQRTAVWRAADRGGLRAGDPLRLRERHNGVAGVRQLRHHFGQSLTHA